MTDDYRWELIDTLRSAKLADLLATVPEVNQRTFIDAAQLLEQQANEIERLASECQQRESAENALRDYRTNGTWLSSRTPPDVIHFSRYDKPEVKK